MIATVLISLIVTIQIVQFVGDRVVTALTR